LALFRCHLSIAQSDCAAVIDLTRLPFANRPRFVLPAAFLASAGAFASAFRIFLVVFALLVAFRAIRADVLAIYPSLCVNIG
jgi:hypothetical protein